jgi:hypothetical protein
MHGFLSVFLFFSAKKFTFWRRQRGLFIVQWFRIHTPFPLLNQYPGLALERKKERADQTVLKRPLHLHI